MEPIRIDIPDAKPAPDVIGDVAVIVAEALREAGVDPRKAAKNAAARELLKRWMSGEIKRPVFLHCLRNLSILNPTLKAVR